MSTITLRRTWSNKLATLGVVYVSDSDGIRHVAFSLEDPRQESKIPGRTRIPEGSYALGVRTGGRWASRFKEAGFPGSLEILKVPGFTDVLIHMGNKHEDTRGCPLIGYSARMGSNPFLGNSKAATLDLYRIVFGKLESTPGYSWKLNIENWERR